MTKKSFLFIFIAFLLVLDLSGQDLTILPVGHSHNDYTRDNPLFDALKYGFRECSYTEDAILEFMDYAYDSIHNSEYLIAAYGDLSKSL